MNIDVLKVDLKHSITKNTTNTLEYLKELISPNIDLYDDIILFTKRNTENNRKLNLNVIDLNSYNVEQNKITIGVLDLINNLESSFLNNSISRLESIKKKHRNKINNIRIQNLKTEEKKLNLNFLFIRLLTISVLLCFAAFMIGAGAIDFFLGNNSRDSIISPNFILHGLLTAIVLILPVVVLQFNRLRKNNYDWKKVWQERLEFEVEGDHSSIMDSLFHTVKNSKYRIVEFNLKKGIIRGKRWWWYSREIDIIKNPSESVLVKISYRYPYYVVFNEFSNKLLLSRFKKQLIEDFQY